MQLTALPSEWVMRWGPSIPAGARVLDVACGTGRHARWLAARGYAVDAVDRNKEALAALADIERIYPLYADIEAGAWPYERERHTGVVVTRYLHRPLFPVLLEALAPGGVLIYETFAAGNERFGKPSNPDFLLRPGELLELVRGRLCVIAYEALRIDDPQPALIQRICAVRRS